MYSLSTREKKTLSALAECVIPSGGPNSYSYKDIDYVVFAEDMINHVPRLIRWFIHFNLWIIQYFSWLWLKRPALFSNLPLQKKEIILLGLSNSRWYLIRGIYVLTSSLFLIPFYKDERVMNTIGYMGYNNEPQTKDNLK